jgi:hypothetical protein
VNVWGGEVSGRGEVPGVGANLDGEGSAVTKVENHSLSSVHPPASLDLPVLYGRYRFADGLENRLQFVLGGGPIILGCSPLLLCWLSIHAPSALADDLYLPTPRILPLHASTREREVGAKGEAVAETPCGPLGGPEDTGGLLDSVGFLLHMCILPLPVPSRPLDDNLVSLLCELSRLPSHTEGGMAFSRLPASQRQASRC